jgi:hypothetical protein
MLVKLKMVFAVVAGVIALAAAAGPAFAHECYNASRSANANLKIAAHSPAFITLDESALGFFTDPEGLGLCEAGAAYLLDQLHAAAAEPDSGIDPTWVISIRSLQAGGLEGASNPRAQENLSNGEGIDHLGENAAIGAVIGANIAAAAALCP